MLKTHFRDLDLVKILLKYIVFVKTLDSDFVAIRYRLPQEEEMWEQKNINLQFSN